MNFIDDFFATFNKRQRQIFVALLLLSMALTLVYFGLGVWRQWGAHLVYSDDHNDANLASLMILSNGNLMLFLLFIVEMAVITTWWDYWKQRAQRRDPDPDPRPKFSQPELTQFRRAA